MTSHYDKELAILRERYQHNLTEHLEQLESLWASFQEIAGIEMLIEMSSLAHRLAGSGKAYGFDKLSKVARSLELVCESAKPLPPSQMSAAIIDAVNSLLTCLRENALFAGGQEHNNTDSPDNIRSDLRSSGQGAEDSSILVVDDDTDFCDKLCNLLRSHGYQVLSLNNIGDFERTISSYSPDAVIVDMDFFGERFAGAKTVLEWRQRNGEPIPVIFISGFESFELRLAAVRAGGNYFLNKPLDHSKLLMLLSTELNLRPVDPYRVLIVDDDEDLLQLYESTLSQSGYAVHTASAARNALVLLEQESPDLLLIDVNMPDCNGIELGRLIRQHERYSHVSLLFMSAAADTDIRLACARLANDEFINKPIEPWRLLMVVKSRSARNRHLKSNSAYPHTAQIEQLQDPLTALPALKTFRQIIQTQLNTLNPDEAFALLKLDIRDFHTVNDLYGHFTGDQVLQRLAWELSQCLSADDILCRESGDEFLVLTRPAATTASVGQLVESILAAIGKPIQFDDKRIVALSADIGIALTSADTYTAHDLLLNVDTALFNARRSTASGVQYFDATMRIEQKSRFNLAQEIRNALRSDQFVAAYQPIFSVADGALQGFEALARWQHPDRGQISPAEFMPIMEEKGFVSLLTQRMLDQALRQLALWRTSLPCLYMSVNLSAGDIQAPKFIDNMKQLLDRYSLPPDCVVLEITETALLADWKTASHTINLLKTLGVKLALDDFGTGYCSLSYLHRIRASTLKIDKSFVHAWSESTDDSLLQTMIQLGHGTGMNVVAEGVETEAELDFLRKNGCDSYQGFLSAKPMHPDNVALADWFLTGLSRQN
ncbi:MAG: EAL domain-containing protein [Pseudohongiella sp.]|nr:EAL domain-containing protein [Pseudohongiella sp.]